MCDHDDDHHDHKSFGLHERRAILLGLGMGLVGSVAASAARAAVPVPGMKFAPTAGIDLIADTTAHAMPTPLAATQADILGPFWRAGAPMLANLIPKGADGQKIILSGRVMDTDGKALSGIVLDFWNADKDGAYDLKNPGQALDPKDFKFRGLSVTGEDGRYEVTTVVPGRYHIPPGLTGFEKFAGVLRPAHLHLMSSSTIAVPLITQIYIDGDDAIPNDPWAPKSKNVIKFDKSQDVWRATFDVVLVRFA